MSLRIVCGKSGSGKSEFLYEEIRAKLNCGTKIYVIVPEQFSFTAERKLMDISCGSVINAEVLTLSRMGYRILSEVGGAATSHLSKVGKAMLIYDILSSNKSGLKFLGKSDKNIDVVSRMITEFKKHGISIDNLNEIDVKDKYLNAKINDAKLVYSKFEERLADNYIDENDVLTILAESLSKSTSFDGAEIYIDEFVGFTFQEYRVIEELLKKAKQITVTVCSDGLGITDSKENDIFYFNKKTVQKLLDVATSAKTSIDEAVILDENYRFKSKELKFIEENIYLKSPKKYSGEPKNLKLFLAKNPYSEVEYVAKEIIKLVRNENYRFRDIGIVTNNLDTYSSDAKAIFEKYDIPIFIDEKKDLSQNVLVKYVSSLFEALAKNYSYESMFNYIKSGLIKIDDKDLFLLENYCRKWNIRNNKWLKDFEYEPINDLQENLNNLRKQIIQPLLKFKENLKNKNTGLEISRELYLFLIEQKIPEILNEKIDETYDIELANEYSASFNVLMNVLEEISMIFENDKLDFNKYKEILQIGLKESGLGKIPATQDQVILGDVDRSRSHKVKAIFIIGMNDGVFPSVNKNEGFLNDKDREVLESEGIELAKGTTDTLFEGQFNIYKSLTIAEEKLFLSYTSSDKESKSLRPSSIITKIKRCFKDLKQESDLINKNYEITTASATFEEAINVYKEFLDGKDISDDWKKVISFYKIYDTDKFDKTIKGFNFSNLPEEISEDNIKRLYGENLKTSVSRLERYRQCPFSFHLEYGLKLKENSEFEIEAVDTGSFMHEVINDFFERLDDENIKVKEAQDDKIKELVEQIIDEKLSMARYYIFSSTPKFKVLTNRLKKVVLKAIQFIVLGLKQSDFDVLGTEVEFGKSSEIKPIVMTLDDGRKVELTGKIDRIDLAEVEGKKYIRIIDYKSSVKSIDYSQVLAGLQLQLITYLDATTSSTDALPAGILYFSMIDAIFKSKKNMTDEDIANEIKKMFKMKGVLLADISVIRAMDNKLDSGYSDIIPIHIGTSGNITSKIDSTVSLDEFSNLQKYVTKLIKDISKEILKGRIDIKPYYSGKKTPCKYCKYKTVCAFSTGFKNNEYNYIDKYDKNVVLEMIRDVE